MYTHIYHLIIFALLAFPLPTQIMTEHKLGWPTVYIHIIQTEATAKWALCRHIYVLSNYNYRNCRDKMAIQKILCLSWLHIYVCVWLSLPVRCNPNWNLQQAVVKGRVLVHSTCSDCHTWLPPSVSERYLPLIDWPVSASCWYRSSSQHCHVNNCYY